MALVLTFLRSHLSLHQFFTNISSYTQFYAKTHALLLFVSYFIKYTLKYVDAIGGYLVASSANFHERGKLQFIIETFPSTRCLQPNNFFSIKKLQCCIAGNFCSMYISRKSH